MSPRRNSSRRKSSRGGRAPGGGPEAEDALMLRITGGQSRETGPDGEWIIRRVIGAAAVKVYRCPGCAQEIPVGMAHVVVWRPYGDGDDRRHWHSSCWDRRSRRAPRY
ncbi:ATP/GTP-binding protein [Nocardiopsis lambiniae]|uniref:ATP/GTP-binding protein n=1 Tax=Nocardiopsis lambiniae TaxID=3075539 RepID=A0ABU2M669_9ACTN|nr:ATP/GTP-binding protein [Nocardiopsis sp. DSM 44743]MDT0327680.1 ATP/GTP-binding protein [Nocardiopsis sp. DSM 44743]